MEIRFLFQVFNLGLLFFVYLSHYKKDYIFFGVFKDISNKQEYLLIIVI